MGLPAIVAGTAIFTGRFSEEHLLSRTQPISAQADEGVGSLRAANERILATGALRRSQPSPVDQMREALREPEDDTFASEPATAAPPPRSNFTAAPALPLDDEQATFVVKPSEGRAARRAMDDLREQALRNVIANAATPSQPQRAPKPVIRRGSSRLLSPFRIILLSIALITGGIAAFLAMQLDTATPEPAAPEVVPEAVVVAPTVPVLVARTAIGIGQRVTAESLEWTDWPEASARAEFVTATVAPEAITEMTGAVARAEIAAGEPILPGKLVAPNGSYLAGVLEPGMRGVSVPISAASASGGFVAPNDRVDVIVTRAQQDRRVTETILQNVRVLAIAGRMGGQDGSSETPADGTFDGETLATLELSAAQGELLVNAASVGEITLVLRSVADVTDNALLEQRTANQLIRATSPFWSK